MGKPNKKAQAVTEFLFVMIIGLVIIGPIYFFAMSKSSDSITTSKTTTAIETIGKNVDYVYSLNKGSVITIDVDLPNGISSYNLSNKTIIFKITNSAGTNSVFYTTKATLNGTLPISAGRHSILLNNTGRGVNIG